MSARRVSPGSPTLPSRAFSVTKEGRRGGVGSTGAIPCWRFLRRSRRVYQTPARARWLRRRCAFSPLGVPAAQLRAERALAARRERPRRSRRVRKDSRARASRPRRRCSCSAPPARVSPTRRRAGAPCAAAVSRRSRLFSPLGVPAALATRRMPMRDPARERPGGHAVPVRLPCTRRVLAGAARALRRRPRASPARQRSQAYPRVGVFSLMWFVWGQPDATEWAYRTKERLRPNRPKRPGLDQFRNFVL